MADNFFEKPILNSPYEYPSSHWELDEEGQPTNRMISQRRRSELITPVPKPKKRRKKVEQGEFVFNSDDGLSTAEQQYDPTPIINEIRSHVDTWRSLPNSNQWLVTPETASLLEWWRHHEFQGIRPFFCQVEAVETAIWLTEVAPKMGPRYKKFGQHLAGANAQANPDLFRIALKLATGAGKTTVFAMLIAWQTLNAVRKPDSKVFTKGFLIITPGITIRDRLRVFQPSFMGFPFHVNTWPLIEAILLSSCSRRISVSISCNIGEIGMFLGRFSFVSSALSRMNPVFQSLNFT